MRRLIIAACVLTVMTALLTAPTEAQAKRVQKTKMFLFGFAASFKDSVVYMTDIQELNGASVDTKTKFLVGREHYSSQLKQFLATQRQEPDRVCVVMFAESRPKAEKRFLKLRSKYTSPKLKKRYDVRQLSAADFSFQTVEVSDEQ